jgi:hypothetical protein
MRASTQLANVGILIHEGILAWGSGNQHRLPGRIEPNDDFNRCRRSRDTPGQVRDHSRACIEPDQAQAPRQSLLKVGMEAVV